MNTDCRSTPTPRPAPCAQNEATSSLEIIGLRGAIQALIRLVATPAFAFEPQNPECIAPANPADSASVAATRAGGIPEIIEHERTGLLIPPDDPARIGRSRLEIAATGAHGSTDGVEINAWLAPYMRGGGVASATTLRVGGTDVPSWKRLLIEVCCDRRAPSA